MDRDDQARCPALWERPMFWLLLAAVVRLLYLLEQSRTSVLFGQQLLDEAELAATARQLLAGQGFGAEPFFKAPLYPVFLAAVMAVFGETWFFAARLIQHAMGAVLVLLAGDAAGRLAPPGRQRTVMAVVAATFLTFYGPLIRLEDRLVLDFMAVFTQSAMLWALIRMTSGAPLRQVRTWAAVAGGLAMLAWLTRPTITPVLPLVVLWILGGALRRRHWGGRTFRRRVGLAVLFCALPVVALLAVGTRNAVVGGEWMVLPWQGGYNFYQANRQGASGKFLAQSEFSLARSGNPTRELALAGADGADSFSEVQGYWMDLAKGEILGDPADWFGLMSRKAVFLVSEREVFNFEAYEIHRGASWLLRWMPFGFGALWPLALASLAFRGTFSHGRARLFELCWLYAVLLAGAIALYYVSGRMRMPLVFPAALLAAVGLVRGAALVRDRGRTRQALAFVILLLAGTAMSWGDWWNVRSESFRHADFARLSNAAFRSGDALRALEYADAAANELPGYPAVPQLRGQALYALGRFEDAAQAFTQSMTVLPGDPVAPYNLGVIAYYEESDPRKALDLFLEAHSRQPSYHQAAWRAAMAAISLREWDVAEEILAPDLAREVGEGPLLLLTATVAWRCHTREMQPARQLLETIAARYGQSGLSQLRSDFEHMGLEGCLGELGLRGPQSAP